MLIDCDTCAVKGPACSGCVVSVVLGAPPEGVVLDGEEQQAFRALAEAGLVPPLRLVPRSRGDVGPDRSVAAAGRPALVSVGNGEEHGDAAPVSVSPLRRPRALAACS